MLSFNPISLFVVTAFLFHNSNAFEFMKQSSDVDILEEQVEVTSFLEPVNRLDTQLRCGEVLNQSSSAGIFYEAFGQVLSNERCAWVIGVPGARGYRISIYYMDSSTNRPNSRQNLVVTGIRHGGWTGLDSPVLTSHKPENVGTFEVPDSNIVIVTFYSQAHNNPDSRGFVLQYQPILQGNINATALQSRHAIYGSEFASDIFRYPIAGSYFSLELSAFIFPPSNNIYSGRMEHILYESDRLYYYRCADSLFFYKFNQMSPAGVGIWEPNQHICGNITSTSIPNDDMMLALFQSDSSGNVGGFRFSNFIC